MKYIILIILVIVLNSEAFAQRGNPFEIKDRLEKLYTNSDNPFEVGSEKTEVVPKEGESVSENTVSPVQSIEQKIQEPQAVTVNKNNPFEVDHVPIRRSQLREKSAFEDKEKTSSTPSKEGQKSNPILPVNNQKNNGLLTFIISIISLVLIAIVANTRRSLFSKLSKSFFNDNFLKLTQREENGGLNGAFVILYVLFFLNFGTFLYLIINHFNAGKGVPWWILVGGVTVIYLCRHMLLGLLATIFPVEREAKQYNFMIAVFNLIIGLILIPLNLIIAYATDSLSVATIFISLGIFAFVYVIRYAKGFLIGMMGMSRSVFHFLLYLCTFEIVPILLLYKVVKSIGSIS